MEPSHPREGAGGYLSRSTHTDPPHPLPHQCCPRRGHSPAPLAQQFPWRGSAPPFSATEASSSQWSSVLTLRRQYQLGIYQSSLSTPSHKIYSIWKTRWWKGNCEEKSQCFGLRGNHGEVELKWDSFEKQGMLLSSQAGKFWPLTFMLNVHVWQTTIREVYFTHNFYVWVTPSSKTQTSLKTLNINQSEELRVDMYGWRGMQFFVLDTMSMQSQISILY